MKYVLEDTRPNYKISLLKLAMEMTYHTDGPYQLKPIHDEMSQARMLSYLEEGKKVNVSYLAVNNEREERFLSIKIPILRGLLGYRVLAIHKNNKDKFAAIHSFEQLKTEFVAGFGSHWADMSILQNNNIPVVGTASYNNLFTMLSHNRFHYFPRGINEAWKELEARKQSHPNLVIDQNIAFYYPYPVYFYVNKKDVALADRIERGLNIALKNGEFKKLFLKHQKNSLKKLKLSSRKLFKLKNISLPLNTPTVDTSWWLKQKCFINSMPC